MILEAPMKTLSLAHILRLNISERILLVEDIWDSIAAVPGSVEISPGQRQELDRRLAKYHKNPAAGSPWEKVKKRIRRLS